MSAVCLCRMPDKIGLAAPELVLPPRTYKAGMPGLPLSRSGRRRVSASDAHKRGTYREMRKINVIFEKDPGAEDIEVLIRAPERDGEVEALIERAAGRPPDVITVTDTDGAVRVLDPGEIISVSTTGKYTQIVTGDSRFIVRQTLQSFEEKLESQRFVRVSRHEIVNLDKVLKFDFTLGGMLRIELAGGMETWASRRNIPLIRRKILKGE